MSRKAPKVRRLHSFIRQSRRATLCKMLMRKFGYIKCYVCGRPVKARSITLEHIIPKSLGGTDDYDNLAISHYQCNMRRGSSMEFPVAGYGD